MTKKTKYAQVKHLFLYKTQMPDGTQVTERHACPVIPATASIDLLLDADTVARSQQANGAGSTSLCAGAMCTYRYRDLFPHPTVGWCDFLYSRVFIVTKLDRNRKPAECVVYEHGSRAMARLNDAKDGHQKLLARIKKYGPIVLRLRPYRQRSDVGRPGSHRVSTGVRSPMRRVGAQLRYAVMKAGALPELKKE